MENNVFKIRRIRDTKTDNGMGFVFGAWRDSAVGIPLVLRDGGRNTSREIFTRRAVVQPSIHKALDTAGIAVYLAEINEPGLDNEYAGFIVGQPDSRQLHYLYVKKIYRRMGLGTSLLHTAFSGDSSDILCLSKGSSKEWKGFVRGRRLIQITCV